MWKHLPGTRRTLFIGLTVCLLLSYSSHTPAEIAGLSRAEILPLTGSQAIGNAGVPFIANQGQTDERVAFVAQTFGGTVFITQTGAIIYSLPQIQDRETFAGVALKEVVVGGRTTSVRGIHRTATRVSYFTGNDPAAWTTGIATFDRVDLGEIYHGITLTIAAHGNNVEKLYRVQPGADPGVITMRMEGGMNLTVDNAGKLVVRTTLGPVAFTKPVAFQNDELGNRTEIEVAYEVRGNEYGYRLGHYDRSAELIIDPLLASTFLGGGQNEYSTTIVVDDDGNVFVAGETASADFPTTTGVYTEESPGGSANAFIAKFNSSLTTLLASTFLGGSGYDANATIILDPEGNIYCTGSTNSANFPCMPGAYDDTFNGGSYDGFVAKFDGDLTTLLASSYLGGSGNDFGHDIVLLPGGDLYLAGETASYNFPTTSGAYDTSYNGGSDAYVALFDSDLTTLSACTLLGGSSGDGANAMVIDAEGNIFITGWTSSYTFPMTPGSYDESYNGGQFDAFLSKLDGYLTTLETSTYLGSNDQEYGYGIACGSGGEIYITGWTYSSGFPTTPGAYDENLNGNADCYISRFDNDLTILASSTVIGGSSRDGGGAIVLSDYGDVYIAGLTDSADFPTTTGAYDDSFNGGSDHIICKLDGDLTNLLASTFLGGNGSDALFGIAIDPEGSVYLAGTTESPDSPVTAGAHDQSYNGNGDVFVAKLDGNLLAGASSVDDIPALECSFLDCYPNPCRQGSSISFELAGDANIHLAVYDFLGRKVRTVYKGFRGPGSQTLMWDGADNNGRPVSSGIYLCRLGVNEAIEQRPLLVVK